VSVPVPEDPPPEAHRDDLALARACARGEREALAAFEAMVAPVIAATAARFGRHDFVAEVGQLVRRRLLVAELGKEPHLVQYRGRGSLAKFVQAVTVRQALNLLESDARHAPAQGDEALLETPAGGDDPELAAIKGRYRAEFKQAFAAAMATLEEASRTALRLHYLDGLTLAEVGGLYGWSVPTASRRLAAARAALLEATRACMAEKLKLSRPELDSVLRLIESRLSVEALRVG
jgi:RNA polymerase sigma-70 factor (ECF subfamily)